MTADQQDPSSSADGAGFVALGLDDSIVATLSALGYEEPTPIQREAIPVLLDGRDVLGQAATGTGKTAAFALPLVQQLAAIRAGEGERVRASTRALVLVPTRELAMQVAEAVHKYGRQQGVTVVPIYGGQSMEAQLRVLKRGVDIVVATPGRAHDHVRRRTLRLDDVRFVVLDEADEMLDMGFADDLTALLDATPAERQTALFSATLPPRIAELAEKYLRDPERIRIAREAVPAGEMPKVRQVAYVVPRAHKLAALGRVLDVESPTAALVFCRTRHEVDELTESLNGRGYRAEALHGGMSQEQRDRVMKKFRGGSAELLIATDVAARGLDIPQLSHVVNYDVPSAPETYVHRIGRTGRAGREGVAVTFVEPREHRLLRNIEHTTKQKIDVEAVPSVADLRARRLELTRASLHELLTDGELDQFRVAVESLSDEFDVMDIAAAAVKLAHQATSPAGEEEQEIPVFTPPAKRDKPAKRDAYAPRGTRTDRSERAERGERSERAGPPVKTGKKPARRSGRDGDTARIFIGAGRKLKVRPADLVGAIMGEVGLEPGSVGAIEISDRFSLVEVPARDADRVIDALSRTTIRGKSVTVRRDQSRPQRGE